MINNPILTGFSPDPSIIRAGNDYYIATSTFEWWPGVHLFHSTDLDNWEQIKSPLRRNKQLNMVGDPTSGGVWAPCLSYDGEYYYLVYTDVKTKKGRFYNTHNYVVYTKDIYGDWSDPVYLNSIGFDPSLFHDVDGKKYLVNMVNGFKGILVQEIEPVTFKLIGERKKVYDGSGIGCTEGPHMYHIGDWYYLIVAEGGTGYDHCVTMARSKSVWGPFETMPGNPILTSDKNNMSALQKCGHADIVDTPDGEWYMVHLCSRPLNGQKWCTLGRETAIQKVCWDADGWLRLENGSRFPENCVRCNCEEKTNINHSEDITDNFDSSVINVAYSSPRASYYDFTDLSSRKGYMRIYGKESMNSLHSVSLLATRQRTFNVEVSTCMDYRPDCEQQMAGLTYMYDAMNFYLLAKTVSDDGKQILVLLKSDSGIITDETDPVIIDGSREIELRAQIEGGQKVLFSYRYKGESEWKAVGREMTTEILTDEHCRGFTGAHFGIYAHDMAGLGSYADYDYFYMRNF